MLLLRYSNCRTWEFGGAHASTKVTEQQVGVLFTKSSAAPIISLSNSGTLNYLDPSSSTPIRSVHGHQGSIETMCVVKEAETIFTGSYDGRVCAWDIAVGDAKVITEEGAKVGHLTPSGESVLYSIQKKEDEVKKISLDDLSSKYPKGDPIDISNVLFTDYEPRGIAVQDDLTFVATIKDIKIMQNGQVIAREETEFTPTAIAANPAVPGEFVVGAADVLYLPNLSDQEYSIHIYSYVNSKLTHKKAHKYRDQVTCLAYSTKGDVLAVGYASSHIVLYSADKDYQVLSDKFTFHNGRIKDLAFNASGTHFLSASLDSHVYVWAVPGRGASGKIKIDGASGDGVYGVGWLGEKRIVTTGHDAAVKIWDVDI
jgi:WD repeat-containing protein 1 (actin-interacting protein 1)